MDEELRRQLIDAGVDVDSGMERFMGNKDLLMRFLRKFPGDNNYRDIVSSLESGDYETAFRAAHTLKGLCGNLSLTKLQEIVSEQTELLRAEKWEEAKAMMPQVTEVYNTTIEKLAPLL